MTRLALVRHGPTPWNRQGLLQGRTDVGLDETGRREVSTWRLPDGLADWRLLSSPLVRAAETARLLTGREPEIDVRLTETDWGHWEGRDLGGLRRDYGDGAARDGLAGLDFRAPGGESPRQVQDRLRPLLAEIARSGTNTLAVTHKGVIRAVYALARDWDMLDKPPEKLRDGLHVFRLEDSEHPLVDRLNVPLEVP